MSLEKSTLLSLRCNEINFRLESEFLSRPLIFWQSCTKDRFVRVVLKSSVASSSFSDLIVSWMTRSSCSSGVRDVRDPFVEDKIELGVQFSRAGWVSFASAIDNAILQLALHAVHLDTEVIVESVWSLRSSSSNWLSPPSLFAPITHSWLSTVLRHSVLPTRMGYMPATPSFAFQTAPAVQVASLVKRDHHSAQQLLLFTVVTCCHQHSLLLHRLVVALIVCTGSKGGARCLLAGSFFSCKGWATTPSYALSPYSVRGCTTHRSLDVAYALVQVRPALSDSTSDWRCRKQTA